MLHKVRFFLFIIIIIVYLGCQQASMKRTFPTFDGISVTDSMQFFFNQNKFQMLCVDTSNDTIVKKYDLGYRETFIYHFIYIPSRKKAYFMFWGDEDILMEFDPATGKSRRIGTQSYCNASTVFLNVYDNDGLMIQDNYGHPETGRKGALYRYDYASDTVAEQPYKFLYTSFKIDAFGDEYITYSPTYESAQQPESEYLYNWTKQEDTSVDIVKSIPYSDSVTYIYSSELFGMVDYGDKPTATNLYRIESFIPFKISENRYDRIDDVWISEIIDFDDYLIMLAGRSDIIRYDYPKKEIQDKFRNHYSDKEIWYDIDNMIIIGKYIYTTNSYESDTVLKISTDDFSIVRVKK